ncbi:5'/3'-nucleotidase SurE [Corallococcus macrosporus]|uniref:5'-nucleotidase SurE n=2 Tax=Myxococcaceae TaxID=31 RepID=A0A250JZ11_9BACT|nr:5'/3'-nucleotidase SurE [Corallococcus macrosporus]AEI67958.1 5'(3')-nucleotidase/polyphosphatase [Corallococcus macrosporus]ATB48737.1 stationary phase survival protein SurE [Corallococcus macrosporus DSM 14697]
MSDKPKRILVSNDDGYFSEGLQALVEAVSPLGEVWVVAPDREQSAASHAISLHRPLRIKEVRERWFAVDGTPADCAYLAINHLLKDDRPVLMVSGINHGANLAEDIMYSGTVAAAMEGALLGVPAIAFSLVARRSFDFAPGARFARSLVASALSRPLPPRMLLNVNIPGGVEPEGFVVTRQGRHSYGYEVVENEDPRGRKYYWIGGSDYQHEDIPGSDCNAVFRDKRISVTPLHFELTDHGRLPDLSGWRVDGFNRHEPDGA